MYGQTASNVTKFLKFVSFLYQINTNKCTCVSLNHHFIDTILNFNVFKTLQGIFREYN